jgi:hypothetical protein
MLASIVNTLIRPVRRGEQTMDGRHFDRWTQALAGPSRRDALKLLVASLSTWPLLTGAAGRAAAQVAPLACGKEKDPCNERNGNKDCCSGYKCKNDKCRKKDNDNNNNDKNDCGRDRDPCDERNGNRDCCNDFKCKNDKCRPKD